ncbi:MAG: glycosyltransferase [Candidatus Binatia bacterium]
MTRSVIRLGSALSRIPVRIIFNSRASAVQHARLGYATRRTAVIPNGFDCEQYSPSKTVRQRVRQALGIADSSILIGLIARHHPMKDHTTFFRAAGILAKQYGDVQFLLAGPGITADNEEIAQLVSWHELGDRIRLLGERADISELNNALDIACSCSYYGEAFSNAIGEAMACGIPCIVTDVGDSKWIVGDTGRVVQPRDADAFAGAVKALIAAGREERLRLGLNARRRILSDFSLDKVVQVYETLYEETHRSYMRT